MNIWKFKQKTPAHLQITDTPVFEFIWQIVYNIDKETAKRFVASAHLVICILWRWARILMLSSFSCYLRARKMVATRIPKAIINDNAWYTLIVTPPIHYGIDEPTTFAIYCLSIALCKRVSKCLFGCFWLFNEAKCNLPAGFCFVAECYFLHF